MARSDEVNLEVTWWQVLLFTITIVLLGMFTSIGCRFVHVSAWVNFYFRSLAGKNCKGCFHCNLCSSDIKTRVGGFFVNLE